MVYTGPSISLKVRYADAERYGLDAEAIANVVNTAMLGKTASSVLEGDQVTNIRVRLNPKTIATIADLRELPLRAADGTIIHLYQVADVQETPGQLELERNNLRQNVSITASLENRDLGSAMRDVRAAVGKVEGIAPGDIEYGGLYQQQQESFQNLLVVLAMAIVLVFTVALVEFRSFAGPVAIVLGRAAFGLWHYSRTTHHRHIAQHRRLPWRDHWDGHRP